MITLKTFSEYAYANIDSFVREYRGLHDSFPEDFPLIRSEDEWEELVHDHAMKQIERQGYERPE